MLQILARTIADGDLPFVFFFHTRSIDNTAICPEDEHAELLRSILISFGVAMSFGKMKRESHKKKIDSRTKQEHM